MVCLLLFAHLCEVLILYLKVLAGQSQRSRYHVIRFLVYPWHLCDTNIISFVNDRKKLRGWEE